ncbi:MAG TPA: CvpA family protein [Candidatus Paceibacterota bacterium]|nr:CvpA family protein [Verrucomicrobiota bacterium]HSA11202.1 CvpA family protein [Candidatus Paceibacterota bacterium]
MSIDQLPINFFDLVLIVVLMTGIYRGRKHGMSEELLSLLTWLGIVFGCAFLYQPGAQLIGEFTSLFGQLTCYLLAYVIGALLVVMLFIGIKRALGGKLLGSDVFGRAEYYLGMGSGLVRFSCILLAVLALLNARYFSPTEVRAMEKFQNDLYGSNFFPTLHTVQATVFDKSLTGPWIKENLGFLLIKPTEPEDRQLHQKEFVIPGAY